MRTWTVKRMHRVDPGSNIAYDLDMITTPEGTIIWVPVPGPGDEGRAQFIVDACNAAEFDARIRRIREVGLQWAGQADLNDLSAEERRLQTLVPETHD